MESVLKKPIWLPVRGGPHDGNSFYPAEDKVGTVVNLGDDSRYMISLFDGELCVIFIRSNNATGQK